MGVDLTQIAQQLTNVIQNGANVVKRLFDLHYNPTPIDVELPWIDENGQLITYKIPNDAKRKQTYLDIVGEAIAKMSVSYFVDPQNGSDTNPGTESEPFKTLAKALTTAPVGGFTKIYLKANNEYILDYTITLANKTIYLTAWGYDELDSFPVVKNLVPENDEKIGNSTGIIPLNLTMFTYKVNIETASYPDSDYTVSLWEGFFKRYDNTKLSFIASDGQINLKDTPFIRVASGPSGILDTYFYSVDTIQSGENRDALLIYNEVGNISFQYYGGSSKDKDGNGIDIRTLVSGVVKDADSGNPINLISNINFSD